MLATSAGEANRLMSEVGRTFSKNSFSNASNDLPSVLASASTYSSTPRDFVGPGSTLLTVMPVPAPAPPYLTTRLRKGPASETLQHCSRCRRIVREYALSHGVRRAINPARAKIPRRSPKGGIDLT